MTSTATPTNQVTAALALATIFANDELRESVNAYIKELVFVEVMKMSSENYDFTARVVNSREPDIKRMALRALKEHFNNPTSIY